MSLLTLPPVSNRSLISGAGSSNRGQRIESNRPNQTSSPRLVGLPGTQTGQKGKSPRRKRSNDDLQFDEEKLRAQQFWVAWGRQMAADMLKASMEVSNKHHDCHAMLSLICVKLINRHNTFKWS